jgi:hypothetical protein
MRSSTETVSNADDWLDQPLQGAKAIGECRYVQKNEEQTAYLLRKGLLDATKRGRLWVTTPRRLRDQLAGNVASHLYPNGGGVTAITNP